MRHILITLFSLFFVFSSQAKLVEHIETNSFVEIQKSIHTAIAANGWERDQVLLVFDIDNTLLTMNQDLGGDAWFTWQESLIFDPNADESLKAAADFGGLLKVQGYLFALGNMTPPEANIPMIIEDLKTMGRSMLLTSRGYDYRNSTERELSKNGYSFDQAVDMAMASKGFAGKYKPYDLDNPSAAGLTADDMTLAKNRKSRTVTYMDGLYMTAGQHKGVMLKAVLHKLGYQPKAIFFVDDHKKHTDRMAAAYAESEHSLYTYHYTAMKPQVDAFNKGEKNTVVQQWNTLKVVFDVIFK